MCDPQKEKSAISSNYSKKIHRIRIDESGSLVIQRVRKEDHGRYQCSAKNLAATRDSRPVRLKIHGKSIFFRYRNFFNKLFSFEFTKVPYKE